MKNDKLSREEVMNELDQYSGHISTQIREVKKANFYRECIYVEKALAAKEHRNGTYKLCNEFCR